MTIPKTTTTRSIQMTTATTTTSIQMTIPKTTTTRSIQMSTATTSRISAGDIVSLLRILNFTNLQKGKHVWLKLSDKMVKFVPIFVLSPAINEVVSHC